MRICIMKSLYIHFLMPSTNMICSLHNGSLGVGNKREMRYRFGEAGFQHCPNGTQWDLVQVDERTELDAGLGGIAFIYTH